MSYNRSSRYLKIKLKEIEGELKIYARDGRYGLSDRVFFGEECLQYLAEILVRHDLDKEAIKEIKKFIRKNKKKKPEQKNL